MHVFDSIFLGVFLCLFPPRDDNLQLSSDIITDRISNYVLKTVSDRVFILIGKMKLRADAGKLCYVCKYIKTF